MSDKIMQFNAPKDGRVDLARAKTKHPKAKAFLLAQVSPDVDLIIKMAEQDFATEMYVIDMIKDIPQHFPQKVRQQIEEFLKENRLDERDNDVCVISPFLDVFRGFIVEIFDRADAEEMIEKLINNGFEGKIKGMIFKDLSTPNRTYYIDGQLDAHDRTQRRLNEEAMEEAISKAKVINRMW